MTQIKITTHNLDYPRENDCLIPEDDPLHEIKKSLILGGLKSADPELVKAIIEARLKKG
jgi:hypothetical protein